MEEKFSEITQIRNVHQMGQIMRAEEKRIEWELKKNE